MMENLHLPLDLIAEETMRLGQELTDSNLNTEITDGESERSNRLDVIKKRMQEYLQNDDFCEIEESLQEEVFPENSGVIFRICESAGTYIVRSIISENINDSMGEIDQDFTASEFKKLRLEEKADLNNIKFFVTDNLSQAEVLHEHFSNRRLPKDEDVLCNISDPGFSWWLDTEPGNLKIYFKSHGVECSTTFLKLGPLSDINIFKKRMRRLNEILETCTTDISIQENDSFLNVSCALSNQLFKDLKGLLLEGKLEMDSTLFGVVANDLTMSLYLKELSIVRQFWVNIEMILNSNQKVQ